MGQEAFDLAPYFQGFRVKTRVFSMYELDKCMVMDPLSV